MVELGPFNYLGLEALTKNGDDSEGDVASYKPDFSAKVINKARLLKISRK